MKKGDFIIILAGLAIMAIVLVIYQLVTRNIGDEREVVISYQSQEIYSIELKEETNLEILIVKGEVIEIIDRTKEPNREFKSKGKDYNIVKIHNNGIQVIEADCRTQEDVKKGFTNRPLDVILCAPHNLSIVIMGARVIDSDFDGEV